MRGLAAIIGLLCLLVLPAQAQDPAEIAHDIVRPALLHLSVAGEVQDQREPIVTQGTGFLVSDQGYVLTTAHLFAEQRRRNAINLAISGRFGDATAAPMKVALISSLPELDLVLLRVLIPVGTPPVAPLQIGSADALRRGVMPPLLTSGFHDHAYRRLAAPLNDTEGRDVPYAWTLNVKTNSGQSGSPVYYNDQGVVRVIGLLKSTARTDDERSQMIPIDYAMALIGHLRMDRIEQEIARLQAENRRLRVGIGLGEDELAGPPLIPRVQRIEPVVDQVQQHISWQPEVQQDGSLAIVGRRLVRGTEVPEQVNYLVTPIVTYRDVTATRAPLDDELRTPRVASDRLTLTYSRPDFERVLTQHIQRKLGIRPGESFVIDMLEFSVSLPQTGTDAAEKFRITLDREVVAE